MRPIQLGLTLIRMLRQLAKNSSAADRISESLNVAAG
jgi:hypothetical protein